jgi:hypothetical protein
MPIYSGTFATIGLAELLRQLTQARRTGHLVLQDLQEEGRVTLENGLIVNAKTGATSGMPALFQMVGWREAAFEFREEALAADFPRDLSVYDPEVLIRGVAAKVEEWVVQHPGLGVAPLAATG